MQHPSYIVAYDVSQEGIWRDAISNTAVPLLFVLAGIAVLIYSIRRRQRDLIGFVSLWLIVSICVGLPGSWNVVSQRMQCIDWLRTGDFEIVEGPVANFKPMPYTGHSLEVFTVNNVTFRYSDYDISQGGFNNTASHGGPIHEGLHVRIAHRQGRILRLEITQ